MCRFAYRRQRRQVEPQYIAVCVATVKFTDKTPCFGGIAAGEYDLVSPRVERCRYGSAYTTGSTGDYIYSVGIPRSILSRSLFLMSTRAHSGREATAGMASLFMTPLIYCALPANVRFKALRTNFCGV